MSVYEEIIAIHHKRGELLEQIQKKTPALIAEQVRTLYPTASYIEIEYEGDVSSDGVGLYYAHGCYIYDTDDDILFEGNVQEVGRDEDGPIEQETIDLMEILELADWHLEYEYEQDPRVVKFPA